MHRMIPAALIGAIVSGYVAPAAGEVTAQSAPAAPVQGLPPPSGGAAATPSVRAGAAQSVQQGGQSAPSGGGAVSKYLFRSSAVISSDFLPARSAATSRGLAW